jgi:hypothetical protein
MTDEALGWVALTAGIFIALGVGAIVGAIVESYLERRREREQRLPEPNCRARVVRRWGVP